MTVARFRWLEEDSGLFVARTPGGRSALGYVYHGRSGAWFARVGMSGDLIEVESEAAGKARVEAALRAPVAVAMLRHDAVADPARRNVAVGLHAARGRTFATGVKP